MTAASGYNGKTVVSGSGDETERIGCEFAQWLSEQSDGHDRAGCFVALYGDLGAGKTAFVRGMAHAIAPDAHVFSPTYALVNEYGMPKGGVFRHWDMYRIESDDDLCSSGYYDMECEYTASEWCENIPWALPARYWAVTIKKLGGDRRSIVFEMRGKAE